MIEKLPLSPGLENQRSLLRRAFAQNDGRRIIFEMLEIKKRAKASTAPDLARLFEFEARHGDKPRGVRGFWAEYGFARQHEPWLVDDSAD